jgi:hypothetical protein
MVIHTLKLHWPMFTVFGFYSVKYICFSLHYGSLQLSYIRTSQELEMNEICGCHGSRDSYCVLLICDTVLSGRLVSVFHINIQPPSLSRRQRHSAIIQETTV